MKRILCMCILVVMGISFSNCAHRGGINFIEPELFYGDQTSFDGSSTTEFSAPTGLLEQNTDSPDNNSKSVDSEFDPEYIGYERTTDLNCETELANNNSDNKTKNNTETKNKELENDSSSDLQSDRLSGNKTDNNDDTIDSALKEYEYGPDGCAIVHLFNCISDMEKYVLTGSLDLTEYSDPSLHLEDMPPSEVLRYPEYLPFNEMFNINVSLFDNIECGFYIDDTYVRGEFLFYLDDISVKINNAPRADNSAYFKDYLKKRDINSYTELKDYSSNSICEDGYYKYIGNSGVIIYNVKNSVVEEIVVYTEKRLVTIYPLYIRRNNDTKLLYEYFMTEQKTAPFAQLLSYDSKDIETALLKISK